MTFHIYSTNAPLPSGQTEPDYSRLLTIAATTKELALEKTIKLLNLGAIVWRIAGPNGFLMNRKEIEKEYFDINGKWP